MTENLLWLIPLLPLAGFAVNGLFKLPEKTAGIVGCAGPFAAFALSVAAVAGGVEPSGDWSWITTGELSIPWGLTLDALSSVMILVVTGVGSLIHLYSMGYMHGDPGFSRFFAYLNLFMFSMLVLVLGDNIVLMFLGWEGVGLCSYLLIGFWYQDLNNADAGKKAFITNRVGDFGFLLGIFCLWILYGTLDFAGMEAKPAAEGSFALAAGLLLLLGACGKSAQIPLYVWLPDAMAGPTPVSALIHAATMVTAGVYMVGRMHFLYAVPAAEQALQAMAVIAAATAMLSGIIAMAQNDIKKILAYSTISQLGFMFAGMASSSFSTGMFHVVTHAFFKALLFLGAGAVIHALHNEQDIRKMGGLAKKLPWLAIFFGAGSLALAGFPFSAGFVSKDEILASSYGSAKEGLTAAWVFWMLLITAGLTAFYTTRMYLIVFFSGGEKQGEHHDLHKPGLLMMAPLAILAVLSIFGGLGLKLLFGMNHFWHDNAAVHDQAHEAHTFVMIASFVAFGLGAGSAWLLYGPWKGLLGKMVEGGFGRACHTVVSNKFYVDEIYEYLVVAPVQAGSTAAWYVVDRLLIDGLLVHGTGRLVYGIGSIFRKPATGSVNLALGIFLVGALAALAWLAWKLAQ